MEEKIINSMDDINLTPTDFITLMFERTDEDGYLYIPGWHYDRPGWEHGADGSTDENDSYRCRVDWNIEKYEKLLEKFERHYALTEQISKQWDEITNKSSAEKALSVQLFEFWSTYIKPISVEDMDREKVADIEDRLEIIEWVKQIAKNIAGGNAVEDFEKQAIAEYIDITVSVEEENYRKDYLNKIFKEAENRIGKNICAYDVLIRTRRLCRLFSLNAPKIIIFNEARQLAAAMLLHDYGISREVVDNYFRIRIEREEDMDEEELDEIYRSKKSNSVKSLAPLFIYTILKEKTNSKKHIRLNEIESELKKYPYELTLERKAVSRTVHNLVDSPQFAVFQDKTGVWIEQE